MIEFQWTDELVLEAVGHISKRFAYPNDFKDRWKGVEAEIEKFKQSKQKSKDWEIVAYEKWEYGASLVGDTDKIKSVKRLSDGEVFSVGDNCFHGGIKRFNLRGNEITADFEYGDVGCSVRLAELKKQKQSLFKTEDGKDVYEGDEEMFQVGIGFEFRKILAKLIGYGAYWKTFSTEAAAKEYIFHKRPLLSYDDVWDSGTEKLYSCYDFTQFPINMDKLKQLIQQKLSL